MNTTTNSVSPAPIAEVANRWDIPAEVTPDYSVVIPFYNESDAAPLLIEEILSVMRTLPGIPECICVDDGSTDSTASVLEQLSETYGPVIRIIRFPVNRGQAAALMHGVLQARGETVVTMDGDGQNDPSDIPMLLKELENADLVCGIRAERNDTALRRIMSRLANRIRGRVLGDGMQDSGCALKAMRREIVRALIPIRTLYSFIPAMAVASGFRVVEVPVHHRARNGGLSNYGFRRFAIMPLVDMLGLLWFRRRCILTRDDCVNAVAASRGAVQ